MLVRDVRDDARGKLQRVHRLGAGRRPVALVGALALIVGLAGCGGGSSDGVTNPPPPPPANTINLSDNYFNPTSKTVAVGTTVTWNWTTPTTHSVTFADGPASGNKSSGAYTRTSNAAGTYTYVCTIHQSVGMTGSITVQ